MPDIQIGRERWPLKEVAIGSKVEPSRLDFDSTHHSHQHQSQDCLACWIVKRLRVAELGPIAISFFEKGRETSCQGYYWKNR
jgi:hypothetical protein